MTHKSQAEQWKRTATHKLELSTPRPRLYKKSEAHVPIPPRPGSCGLRTVVVVSQLRHWISATTPPAPRVTRDTLRPCTLVVVTLYSTLPFGDSSDVCSGLLGTRNKSITAPPRRWASRMQGMYSSSILMERMADLTVWVSQKCVRIESPFISLTIYKIQPRSPIRTGNDDG